MKCDSCGSSGAVQKVNDIVEAYLCGECFFSLKLMVNAWVFAPDPDGSQHDDATVAGALPVYLDTSAWISLIRSGGQIQRLFEVTQAGLLQLFLSHETVEELIIGDSVGADRRAINLYSMAPFLKLLSSDWIHILGHTRLGVSKLSSEHLAVGYWQHLENKTKPEDAVSDGIHLTNAKSFNANLVSCDRQIRSSARAQNLSILCLKELWIRMDFPLAGLEECNCQSPLKRAT